MKNIWNCIKSKINAMLKWVKKLLGGISGDKHLHFEAGLIIAALFSLVWPMGMPVLVSAFIGAMKECWDECFGNGGDWKDWIATILGGLIIQIMVWVA